MTLIMSSFSFDSSTVHACEITRNNAYLALIECNCFLYYFDDDSYGPNIYDILPFHNDQVHFSCLD